MAEMERSDIEDSFERSEKQMIRLYSLIRFNLDWINLLVLYSLFILIKLISQFSLLRLSIDLFSLRSNKGIPAGIPYF